jgi:hypothetical protein
MAKEQDKIGKHKYDTNIESAVNNIVVDSEYKIAKSNQEQYFNDYESYMDLFDAERTEKDYDWMSDIFLPEFPAHMLTQSAIDVSQYFQTRDFVECYVQDNSRSAIDAAEANQECINRTLNRRELYFYHKYVQSKSICNITGMVWLKCWWEQKTKTKTVGLVDPITGEKYKEYQQIIEKDCFNFEVLDSRNVFTDSNYRYSAQDKDFITIRSDTNANKLDQEASDHKYFNLDIVRDMGIDTSQTETDRDVNLKSRPNDQKFGNKQDYNLDKIERYGKFWYKDGAPGIDMHGNVIEGATLEECIITVVQKDSTQVLIGFRKTPYKDWRGVPYKPIIRGLCYIHPVMDGGVGDGKYSREIQIGINDTLNASNDRVMLATFPTLMTRKYIMEDTDSLYIAPGHNIPTEDPMSDVRELGISDNIGGAMTQTTLLKNSMHEVTSIFPSTMGNMPVDSSTTATAIVGAEQRSTQRNNYKSMTYENTAQHELFWMITQMTWQFAKSETGVKLMGDLVEYFDPSLDYFYRPLSQSVETEHSKANKIRNYNTALGYVTNAIQFAPEAGLRKFDYIMTKIFELMGDEYASIQYLETQKQEIVSPDQMGGAGSPRSDYGFTQNQTGLPVTGLETQAREGAGGFA